MAVTRSPAGSNRSLRSPRTQAGLMDPSSQPRTRTPPGASQFHNLVNRVMPRQESKRATGSNASGSCTPPRPRTPPDASQIHNLVNRVMPRQEGKRATGGSNASGSCTPPRPRTPPDASQIHNLVTRLMPRRENKRATGGSNTPVSGSCTPGACTRSPVGSALRISKGVGELDFTFKPEDEVWKLNAAETEAAEIEAQQMQQMRQQMLERETLEEAADAEALKMRQIKQLRQQILERDAEEEAAAFEALNAAPLKVRECFYGRREGSASVSASACPRIPPETHTLVASTSPRTPQETWTPAKHQTVQVPRCEAIVGHGYSKDEVPPRVSCSTELGGPAVGSPSVLMSLNEIIDVTESIGDTKDTAEGSEVVKQPCMSEPDLAELVLAAAREHAAVNIVADTESLNNTPVDTCQVQAPEFDGPRAPKLCIPTNHQPPEIQNTYTIDAAMELETETLHGREASALVEMGFRQRDAEDILQQTSLSTEEAANQLLDKESPPESVWDKLRNFLVNEIFGICSIRSTRLDSYRPGTYTILEIPEIPAAMEISYSNVRMMAVDVNHTCSEALGDRIEVGSVVDIVEIQVHHAQQVIRGRTKDGGWVCIASASPDGEVWAEPVPLVQQLIVLGFTESQATEAAKRSSNVNGALEFLASQQ